jgi:hypothetical protein
MERPHFLVFLNRSAVLPNANYPAEEVLYARDPTDHHISEREIMRRDREGVP